MLRLSDQPPEGAMVPQGEAGFPATLSRWVREIVGSIPGPARSTIAELLVELPPVSLDTDLSDGRPAW
jgi:hypothetical protein